MNGMIAYDKLLRDKIPELIEDASMGIVKVMVDNTYLEFLDRKLNEELAECSCLHLCK